MRVHNQKATDEEIVSAYNTHSSVWIAAKQLGMCGQSVHERLKKLNKIKKMNVFRDSERELLKKDYAAAADNGNLDELANLMGRTKQFICRQARLMGLTNKNRTRPYIVETSSINTKKWIAENGHPRGMAGKVHSSATKARISVTSKKMWQQKSEEERSEFVLNQLKAKIAKYGSIATKAQRGSWKAGWREIGGKPKYYRSRWEANYARYLQWLKEHALITDWQHEPKTFWFDTIKRGVRSYLPDFQVFSMDGTSELHEVKGWMDARSKTTLKRMAKYFPSEKIILIQEKDYRKIDAQFCRLIEGWE